MKREMLKVLVIDDSETVRIVMHDELKSMGYLAKTVEIAEEGYRSLREDKFNMVFIDLTLPGMGGLELLGWIADEKIDTIPIIMTGYESPESVAEAVEKGAYGYLIKPIQPLRLNVVVKLALKRYEVEQKLKQEINELKKNH